MVEKIKLALKRGKTPRFKLFIIQLNSYIGSLVNMKVAYISNYHVSLNYYTYIRARSLIGKHNRPT